MKREKLSDSIKLTVMLKRQRLWRIRTVGVNGALNAAILAAEILALGDPQIAAKVEAYKEGLKNKITKATAELKEVKYKFKTN